MNIDSSVAPIATSSETRAPYSRRRNSSRPSVSAAPSEEEDGLLVPVSG